MTLNHIRFNQIDKAKIYKTTQDTREGVEKIKIITDDHDITLFGSRDEESNKERTIELEVVE